MLIINLISLYMLSVAVAVVFCGVRVRTLTGANFAKTALLLCLAVSIYILGYTLELNSSTPEQILFWNRIEYVGIPFVSALWMTTATMYTGCFVRRKKILVPAIFGIPILTLIFRLTNDFHQLYYVSVDFAEAFGTLLLVREAGPWMHVQGVHSASMIIAALGLLIYDSIKDSDKKPGKFILIVLASGVGVAGLFFFQIKPLGLPIDYMALCLPVTCIMVIIAISRYDLLKTKAIARSKVFEVSSDAILLINREYRILDYNQSAKELFEQVGFQLGNTYISGLFWSNVGLLDGLKQAAPAVVKLYISGREHYYEITTEHIGDLVLPHGWIKTIRDVTAIYKLNEELKRQAMTDELSALSNRRAFLNIGRDRMLQSEAHSSDLYLVVLDLDHFKHVNDRYGHPTGDLVIRDFAGLLKAICGENCLIARMGGEEFSVLLEDISHEKVHEIMSKILHAAEQHEYNYFGHQFHVTVSIGMTKRQPGQPLESMMGKADRALYQSKDRGRNCITVL